MENITTFWPVSGDVLVENGVFKVRGGELTSYNPFEYNNLPNAFAKVKDEKSAVDFVKKYGLLGWAGLREVGQGEEPLWWILAHAASVKFALKLIVAISEYNDCKIESVLSSERIKVNYGVQPMPPGAISSIDQDGIKSDSYNLINMTRREVRGFLTSAKNKDNKLRMHAIKIVTDLVNWNTPSVKSQLSSSEDEFRELSKAASLIEVIWYFVGIMAICQQESKGKAIRICDECHTPFLVTDSRQRFCPDSFSKTSLCGAKNRMRNLRQKLNKEGTK